MSRCLRTAAALALTLQCTPAAADYLIMSGATWWGGSLYGDILLPSGGAFRVEPALLTGRILDEDDTLVIGGGGIAIFEQTTPLALIESGSVFASTDLLSEGSVYTERGGAFACYTGAELLDAPGNLIHVSTSHRFFCDRPAGFAGLPRDADGDGVEDAADNCPGVANAGQQNNDGDGRGDACDADDDNDGLSDSDETGVHGTNPLLADTDGDGSLDGEEVAAGTDPRDSNSFPGPPVGLRPGVNLIALPGAVTPAVPSCHALLEFLGGPAAVLSVSRVDAVTGTLPSCRYEQGSPQGADYALAAGAGYLVAMLEGATVDLMGAGYACPEVALAPGMNAVGVPSPAAGESCFSVLESLGEDSVSAVQRLDPVRGDHASCAFADGVPVGDDFPVRQGEGYLIHARTAVPAFNPNDTADPVRCP